MTLRALRWAAPLVLAVGVVAAYGSLRAPQARSKIAADAGTTLPERTAFAGSNTCAACHLDEVEAWKKDWHARALSPSTPAAVVANFKGVHFQGSSSTAEMRTQGARFWMRTRGPDGGTEDFGVDYAIGGKHMQDLVTTFADGRWQVLPVYFHVTGSGAWVDYSEAKQGPLTPDHPFFWSNFRRTVNRECLDCHASGVRVSYAADTHAWTTTLADLGVGCESCHGPGARHAVTQSAEDIVQPASLAKDRQLAVCAQCHGPRQPLFPLLDSRHRFQPGDAYEAFYEPLGLTEGRERSGDFFADGRPKTSSFEYQALMESRCFRMGGATCLTCHTAPHDEHGANELPPGAAPCSGCHAEIVRAPSKHAHHRSEAATRCTACHMPPVVTGVLDTFADHALDIPNPRNSELHGVPSACAVCHAKERPAALQQELLALWPHAAQRQRRRNVLADALDEKTAAASQTALESVVQDEAEAPFLRASAEALLAQRFSHDAGATLGPLLTSPVEAVRTAAARGLALTPSRELVDSLARLTSDASPRTREAAAGTLLHFGDPRGIATFLALAREPSTSALPGPHYRLGVAYARAGRLEDSAQELSRAVALQPYFVEALLALSDVRAHQHDWAAARTNVEEALRFEPDSHAAQARRRVLEGR